MFERTWTVAAGVGVAPVAFPIHNLGIPDGAPPLEISGWKTNFGGASSSPPVVIFDGDVSLAEAQNRVNIGSGVVDALLLVPHAGVARARFGGGRVITVAWMSAQGGAGASDLVQVRICEIPA